MRGNRRPRKQSGDSKTKEKYARTMQREGQNTSAASNSSGKNSGGRAVCAASGCLYSLAV